jgi:uncharacterized protein (TIGR03083 family)
MMSDNDLQARITDEYLALADLLDTLPPERWDTPSLCEGWRVREVVAHMTMPARYSQEAFMAELADCDYDFTRLSNRVAARDAELLTAELVAGLRNEVMHHWVPPGASLGAALNHVVIHGLDNTVPLGEPRRSPDASIRIVLDDLVHGGVHEFFGTDISGRTFEATDIDWSSGSGPPLRGAAEDLALYLCGRKLPDGRLQG